MKGSMGLGYPSYTIWGWGMCNFLIFIELEPFLPFFVHQYNESVLIVGRIRRSINITLISFDPPE